jgi:hypothetical protein
MRYKVARRGGAEKGGQHGYVKKAVASTDQSYKSVDQFDKHNQAAAICCCFMPRRRQSSCSWRPSSRQPSSAWCCLQRQISTGSDAEARSVNSSRRSAAVATRPTTACHPCMQTARRTAEAGSQPGLQQKCIQKYQSLTGILGGVTSRARGVLGLVASVLVAGLLLALAHNGVLQARNNARMSVQLSKHATQVAMRTPLRAALTHAHGVLEAATKLSADVPWPRWPCHRCSLQRRETPV